VPDQDAAIDRELLRRAASEPEAFGAFYRRHVDWVLAFLTRRVDDHDVAADLTAESFAAALIGFVRVDFESVAPNAWLFGIVNNQLHAYWRRGKVSRRAQKRLALQRVVLDDEDLTAIDRLANDAIAQTMLDELPEEQRAAVRLRVLDEHPYEHIADELGVPQATVRKRVSRGLATLRSQLKEDNHG
jgi:RNA polymerase sigma factor (sigma-70 family)